MKLEMSSRRNTVYLGNKQHTLELPIGHRWNQKGNQKNSLGEMKTKFMGCNKSNTEREVYSSKHLQLKKKKPNKQANFMQITRKGRIH